jgi:protein-S-isoprenylcysteine O-methyltransferase Ste14
MMPPGAASALGLFALHALFYAVFVPRWLVRNAAAPRPAEGGGDLRPKAGRTARGSLLPLALHAVAMGTLYCGLDLALLPPAGRLALARRFPGAAAAALTWLVPPLPPAGAVAMLAASALAGWALAVFRSWRLRASLDPGHELCTAGPFRLLRHPIYLAMDLLALGSWLWAPTALVGLGAVLVVLGGDLRARGEERLLLEVFGPPYEEYRRRVRRFLPGVY